MSLRFKNGHWLIDFYEAGRSAKRIQKRLDPGITEEQAHDIYTAMLAQGKNRPVKPLDLGLTVFELTRKYLEWYELYRARGTARDARFAFEHPMDKILGSITAEDLCLQDIMNYQRQRSKEVSNRTVNKELAYLSGCLRWAAEPEQGYITPRTWKIRPLPCQRPIPQVLTVTEVVGILEASEPFYRAIFLCLYSLGLRKNEARQMRWSDVDLPNRQVTVIQKGGKFKRLPLNPLIIEALEQIRPAGDDVDEDGIPLPDFVFLNRSTKKPILQIRKALARACKKAGVTRHVYPHLFRHSFATHLMGGNINLRTIQGFLGHADVKTTEWYTHVLAGHLESASGMITELLKYHGVADRSLRNT